MQFSRFSVLPGTAEAQVIWCGIINSFWLLTLSVTCLPKKYQNPFTCDVSKSYSKPKVGRFFETRCIRTNLKARIRASQLHGQIGPTDRIMNKILSVINCCSTKLIFWYINSSHASVSAECTCMAISLNRGHSALIRLTQWGKTLYYISFFV